MRVALAASAAIALSACGETVTHTEQIPVSFGKVNLVVTSVGGATGDERYELKFDNLGKSQTFFEGTNFTEFSVASKGEKLAIQLCRGGIQKADAVRVGKVEELKIVRLDIDWNCKDKSHEA